MNYHIWEEDDGTRWVMRLHKPQLVARVIDHYTITDNPTSKNIDRKKLETVYRHPGVTDSKFYFALNKAAWAAIREYDPNAPTDGGSDPEPDLLEWLRHNAAYFNISALEKATEFKPSALNRALQRGQRTVTGQGRLRQFIRQMFDELF